MSSLLLLHSIQYAGFIGAQFTNSFLVYLISTRAERLFGSYRHVMCTFAMFSLIYAWIEVFTQPVMHIFGPVFVVYMDSPLKSHPVIGDFVICLYCGSFALVISLLAAQFYYRYIALCRTTKLVRFEGKKLFKIFIPCLICFFLWFQCVNYGMANTIEKQQFLRKEILGMYDDDITKIPFIAPMYWAMKDDVRIWNFFEIIASFGCVCIILTCFTTIIVCALNIYTTLKHEASHLSTKTQELNHQLFVTLMFQTLLPFVMMYAPVGLLFTLPFFEVGAGRLANYTSASLAVYPCLEPIIAMFFIKDFRNAIIGIKRSGSIQPINFTHRSSAF